MLWQGRHNLLYRLIKVGINLSSKILGSNIQ